MLPGHSFVVSSQLSNWGRGVLPGVGVNAWMQCCAVSLCAWCSAAKCEFVLFQALLFCLQQVLAKIRGAVGIHAAASRWFCV